MTKKSGYQTENIGHSDITTYVYMVFRKKKYGEKYMHGCKIEKHVIVI